MNEPTKKPDEDGLMADFVTPETKAKVKAERLARLEKLFSRKTDDDGDGDGGSRQRFRHGAAQCCVNGRTTREVPCQNPQWTHCPLRKNEEEAKQEKEARRKDLEAMFSTSAIRQRVLEEEAARAKDPNRSLGRGRPRGYGR